MIAVLAERMEADLLTWRKKRQARKQVRTKLVLAVCPHLPPRFASLRAKSVARKFEIPQAAQADLGCPDRGGKKYLAWLEAQISR